MDEEDIEKMNYRIQTFYEANDDANLRSVITKILK